MIDAFGELATERKFGIIAPSSGYAVEIKSFTWTVGDKPNDITDDFRHVKACFDEVLARKDVTIDAEHVLIAGFSGGASSAPYIATNAEPYEAFAVLHGGVFIGGIGRRKVSGWFSTGEDDSARTPQHVLGHFRSMREAGFDVSYRAYPGGHKLSNREATELVEWWFAPAL
jgi:predicted esterase